MGTPRNDELAAEFYEHGEHLTASVTIQRPAAELYTALQELTCVPRLVEEVKSVSRAMDGRLTWTGAAPAGADGRPFSAEAELLTDEPPRRFAWRSAAGSAPATAGSVTLRELPFARGTEVKVVVGYIPQQGKAVATLARTLGRDPKTALRIALWRFRQLMETGEIATTRGQPAGRDDGVDLEGSKDEKRSARGQEHHE